MHNHGRDPMTDHDERRRMMVDNHIRTSDVTTFPILAAMLAVPRERYTPPALRETAYLGENLPIARGRVMLDPRTLAKMLDALEIQRGEVVLDIGCGLGYSAAVIARLAETVIAVEENPDLAAEAEATLAAEGVDNVAVLASPLAEGAPRHGPYDVITVQGAAGRDHRPAEGRWPHRLPVRGRRAGRLPRRGEGRRDGRLALCLRGRRTGAARLRAGPGVRLLGQPAGAAWRQGKPMPRHCISHRRPARAMLAVAGRVARPARARWRPGPGAGAGERGAGWQMRGR